MNANEFLYIYIDFMPNESADLFPWGGREI